MVKHNNQVPNQHFHKVRSRDSKLRTTNGSVWERNSAAGRSDITVDGQAEGMDAGSISRSSWQSAQHQNPRERADGNSWSGPQFSSSYRKLQLLLPGSIPHLSAGHIIRTV
jgi:hypothetical protein